MRRLLTAVVIAAMFTAACGKSAEQKKAEEAAENLKKAAETMAQAAEKQGTAAAAQGTNDMAKAMQSMAAAFGGGGDGKTVEPVSTDALKTALPSVSGWEMETPETQRMTSPIPFAEASVDYKQGEKQINLKVVDSGYAQMLIAPWAMFLASGYSRESNDGYEKAVTVAGQPAFERWSKDSKRGELNVFVNKRFLVTIEGDDLADTKVLHDFAGKMDFGKISSLK